MTPPPIDAPAHGRLFYGWIILAAAMTIVGLAMGSLFSLGVFLTPIQESMGWSRAEISSVALITWVALGVGAFLWGMLSDRYGTRSVVAAGGVLLGLGLVLASRVTALWQFYAAFGGMVGLAAGAFYTPLTSTATRWFTASRGLAVALVSAGAGLGTFAIAPLVRWLINAYDWRVAMLVLGDLAWVAIVPLAILVRNAPGDLGIAALGAASHELDVEVAVRDIWRAPQFWLIALTHFACCLAHSGPIFHMAANATDHGIASMVAATIFGLSGLSSIGGRIGAGVLADWIGAKPTLVAMLALQTPAILMYLFAGDSRSLYALALVFGLAYGGVMPVYALLTRAYFGGKAMGTAYGAIYMLQAIGMGLGSFAGGWFYDRFGTYAGLFAFGTAAAAAAVLLALPIRRPRPVMAAAAAAR